MSNSILSTYLVQEPVLLALLLGHFVGDFTFQSQRLADAKKEDIRALGLHLIIVALPLLILAIFLPSQYCSLLLQIWLSHLAIDYCKYFISKRQWTKPSWEAGLFLLDQFLHIICLIILYMNNEISLAGHSVWNVDSLLLLQMLFIVLITKPINILFKLFFSKYQIVEEAEKDATITGAGAVIGQLERLIMGIFLLLGQFTAIGLVFTAKSIARYDKISKNQAFAEYYLIGSLFSIISVLVLYILLIS